MPATVPCPHYRVARWLADTPDELLAQRRREADLLFHRAGITFTLYGDEQGTRAPDSFDTIPRSIPASEWRIVERGCIQRVKALNMFLADLYHEQRNIKRRHSFTPNRCWPTSNTGR